MEVKLTQLLLLCDLVIFTNSLKIPRNRPKRAFTTYAKDSRKIGDNPWNISVTAMDNILLRHTDTKLVDFWSDISADGNLRFRLADYASILREVCRENRDILADTEISIESWVQDSQYNNKKHFLTVLQAITDGRLRRKDLDK